MEDIKLVEILLNNNASINHKNNFGETALIKCNVFIVDHKSLFFKKIFLFQALKFCNKEIAKLLLKRDICVNDRDHFGNTALILG
jgi:ankyrin repeat protein